MTDINKPPSNAATGTHSDEVTEAHLVQATSDPAEPAATHRHFGKVSSRDYEVQVTSDPIALV